MFISEKIGRPVGLLKVEKMKIPDACDDLPSDIHIKLFLKLSSFKISSSRHSFRQ